LHKYNKLLPYCPEPITILGAFSSVICTDHDPHPRSKLGATAQEFAAASASNFLGLVKG